MSVLVRETDSRADWTFAGEFRWTPAMQMFSLVTLASLTLTGARSTMFRSGFRHLLPST